MGGAPVNQAWDTGNWWLTKYKTVRTGICTAISSSFQAFAAPLQKVSLVGMSIGFFLLVYSLVKGFSQTQAGAYMNLKHVIVKVIVLTGLMSFTPQMVQFASDGADDIAAQINSSSTGNPATSGISKAEFPLTDNAGSKIVGCASSWAGAGNVFQVAIDNGLLLVAMVLAFCGMAIADAILIFLYTFRELAVAFSTATLPLGIAMLSVGMLQGIGQKWIMGLIACLLWPVGFALVNILGVPIANFSLNLLNNATPNVFEAVLGAPVLSLVIILVSLLYIGATKVIGAALSGAGDMGGGIVGGAVAMPFKVGGAAAGGAAMVAATAATGGAAAAGMAAAKTAASTARAASK
jgi:hypothetical protein